MHTAFIRPLAAAAIASSLTLPIAALFPITASAQTVGYCWCKTPSGTCENHGSVTDPTDPTGTGQIPIATQEQCNAYCQYRGEGWQAVFYDRTYVDHTNDTVCRSDVSLEKVTTIKLTNPTGVATPEQAIRRIITILIGLSGTMALLSVVYGGFEWTTSMGDAKKVASAKARIVNSFLGLIIITSAYSVIAYIFQFFQGA